MAATTFDIEIATPERLLSKEKAIRAQIPAKDGVIGVLPDHAPLLSELGIGALTYTTPENTMFSLAINGETEHRVFRRGVCQSAYSQLRKQRCVIGKDADNPVLRRNLRPDRLLFAEQAFRRRDLDVEGGRGHLALALFANFFSLLLDVFNVALQIESLLRQVVVL